MTHGQRNLDPILPVAKPQRQRALTRERFHVRLDQEVVNRLAACQQTAVIGIFVQKRRTFTVHLPSAAKGQHLRSVAPIQQQVRPHVAAAVRLPFPAIPPSIGRLTALLEDRHPHRPSLRKRLAAQLAVDIDIAVAQQQILARQPNHALDEHHAEQPKDDDFPASRPAERESRLVDEHLVPRRLRRVAELRHRLPAIGAIRPGVIALPAAPIAIAPGPAHHNGHAAARAIAGAVVPHQRRRHAPRRHLKRLEAESLQKHAAADEQNDGIEAAWADQGG